MSSLAIKAPSTRTFVVLLHPRPPVFCTVRTMWARGAHADNEALPEEIGMRSGIGSLIYVVIGVVLASSHHYFTHADQLKPLLSALLAVALWPLLLLGISLHIK